jgi:hypothetical protein
MTAAERALLRASIDYAGLFPPAALSMADAARNFAEYRRGPDAWALGRFVVTAARLDELASAVAALGDAGPWPLSVLLSDAVARDVERMNATAGNALRAEAIELKASTPAEVRERLALVPPTLERYVEIPVDGDVAALVGAIGEGGGYAKVRTGGVTADAFPAPSRLVAFLRACLANGVPFKATAGLHHPLRAEYRLTYAPDSPQGTMFGFVNVMLATAFLAQGMSDADAARLLDERDPAAIVLGDDLVEWRGHRIAIAAIESTRRSAMRSFGSCSFREPVDELTTLHAVRA